MSKEISIKIKPQYIEYSNTTYKNFKLHKIQEIFYKYDELSEINIIVAPTGTGKTFSFALPIINKKKEKWTFKGLIVSPTNALIRDIKENIKKRFPEIRVGEINSVVLDRFNVKGPERFKMILKIINENEIVLTNPDIINFIIYGGYNYYKGIREFPEIFEKFNFIVYDEYHLYDEEQIANILTLILLRKSLISKEIKFIFTSATPEKGLEEFLKEHNIPYFKYEEKISKRGRKIHGEINLNFIRKDILQFISENKDFIYKYIRNNKKVLIIFDSLRKLKEFKESNFFPELKMVELSGYTTKQETEVKTQDCQIILGTNKIEVGVNLNVNICFMEEGRYLRNFLQRFGRVARGDNNGEVFVFCNKIKPLFLKLLRQEYEYYDFLDIYQNLKKDREFYHQSLPKYIGTFLYAIYVGIKNYS
ncbi:type I-D CRISPR-associated helicase Cas3', partial [bacterium]|nr:type I-D CRISPR-associated helicase Cas3' [bacterium]